MRINETETNNALGARWRSSAFQAFVAEKPLGTCAILALLRLCLFAPLSPFLSHTHKALSACLLLTGNHPVLANRYLTNDGTDALRSTKV